MVSSSTLQWRTWYILGATAPFAVRISARSFHNYPAPPKVTVLYGIVIPQSGGDTEFASVQAAYDDLPETTKRRIAGLTALHAYRGKNYDRKATIISRRQPLAATPSATHPIIAEIPTDGCTGLFLSPNRVTSIPGTPDDEAFALALTSCSPTRRRRSTFTGTNGARATW